MTHENEPEIIVESRQSLIYLLSEAAEIEHGLMCCYLFAAFSLKKDELTGAEREAVDRWRAAILDVARDEMVHLVLVSNLLASIGSAPHFARANFPVEPGYHPAGVVVSLAPFDQATIDHFVYLERPEGIHLPDGSGFSPLSYERRQARGRLVASGQDYRTVGHLYRGIGQGLRSLAASLGEAALFTGDPRHQVGPDLFPMRGLTKVTNLAEAEAAIETIVEQGEGAVSHEHERSHYARFLSIQREYGDLMEKNPAFLPARPVARNPVMRKPPLVGSRVWVSAEPAATLLDLANAAYGLMLRALSALFSHVCTDQGARGVIADLSVTAMMLIRPLAETLTTLPAGADAAVHAGLTFTMSRSLHAPPDARALRGLVEETRAISARIARLDGVEPAVVALRGHLDELAVAMEAIATAVRDVVSLPPAAPAPARAPSPVPTSTEGVERVRGTKLTLLYEGKRCIHSRHCVLDAPKVFLANTPGEWIFPDQASVETLLQVAHQCPSGAIRYERHDGGEEESAPPVNVANVRENGPLAVHAAIELVGQGPMYRATLCRCGASKNKPFCDGSHVAAGFEASGEPKTVTTEPLAVRNGPLVITPRRNGPLQVRGNLELCAGTGRVVSRLGNAAFCRCGGSKNKPFCDGTHAKNGFVADGE